MPTDRTPHAAAAPPRLRHVCVLTPQLEPAIRSLRAAFGLEVAWRDPSAHQWEVENAMLPVGHAFLQLCAPLHPTSAAARYLAKRPQGGGCLVALECDDLERRHDRLAGLGLRTVARLQVPGFAAFQYHPRDLGGCMLELNQTRGGGRTEGPYGAAGPQWQHAVRTQVVRQLGRVEMRARAPERMASLWAQVTERALGRDAQGRPALALGPSLHFGLAQDDDWEGIAAIELSAADPVAALERARAAGMAAGERAGTLRWLGLEIRLVAGR